MNIILFIFSAANFTNTVEVHKFPHNIELVSEYLKDYDSNYSSKVIMADSSRFYSWYLNTKVKSHTGVDETTLESSNVTYLISLKKIKTDKFYQIFKSGNYRLYKRIYSIKSF